MRDLPICACDEQYDGIGHHPECPVRREIEQLRKVVTAAGIWYQCIHLGQSKSEQSRRLAESSFCEVIEAYHLERETTKNTYRGTDIEVEIPGERPVSVTYGGEPLESVTGKNTVVACNPCDWSEADALNRVRCRKCGREVALTEKNSESDS